MRLTDQIGVRIKRIREDLSKNRAGNWTQVKIAKIVGFPDQSFISRLESGKGSSENLMMLLNFYYKQGYNPNWVIIENNELMPFYIANDDLFDMNVGSLSEDLENVRKNMNTQLGDLIKKYHS